MMIFSINQAGSFFQVFRHHDAGQLNACREAILCGLSLHVSDAKSRAVTGRRFLFGALEFKEKCSAIMFTFNVMFICSFLFFRFVVAAHDSAVAQFTWPKLPKIALTFTPASWAEVMTAEVCPTRAAIDQPKPNSAPRIATTVRKLRVWRILTMWRARWFAFMASLYSFSGQTG